MDEIVIFDSRIVQDDSADDSPFMDDVASRTNQYLAERLVAEGVEQVVFANPLEAFNQSGTIHIQNGWWYAPEGSGSQIWHQIDNEPVKAAYLDIPRVDFTCDLPSLIAKNGTPTLNSTVIRKFANDPTDLRMLAPEFIVPSFKATGDVDVKNVLVQKKNQNFGDEYRKGHFIVKPLDGSTDPVLVNVNKIGGLDPFEDKPYIIQPFLETVGGPRRTVKGVHAFRATMSGVPSDNPLVAPKAYLMHLVLDRADGGHLVGRDHGGTREYWTHPRENLAGIEGAMDLVEAIGSEVSNQGGRAYEIHFAIGQGKNPRAYGIRTSLTRFPREWNAVTQADAKDVNDFLAKRIHSFVSKIK